MSHLDTTDSLLDAASRALLASFCLGMLLLLLWVGLFVGFGDSMYAVHGALFKISRPHFDTIHYAGMALIKILLFVLFLFPSLSIRWILRRRRACGRSPRLRA